MFTEKAKMIFANLRLATIARNKLKASNRNVACEMVRVPTGVEIVRSTPDEPVVAAPEVESQAKPIVVGEAVTFTVRVRSTSAKWIALHEPMPNGTIWVYRPHVAAINRLHDSDSSEIVVPLKIARKKGWVA